MDAAPTTGPTGTTTHDVAILGGGPGGYGAAFIAHGFGLDVVLVEKDRIGGTCLHRGCIPAKSWLHVAETFATVSEAALQGVMVDGFGIDWEQAWQRKEKVVASLHGGLVRGFASKGIEVVEGVGRLVGANRLEVDTPDGVRSVSAANIIVATGSRPRSIPGYQFDRERIVSSDDALEWRSPPGRVAILGGGAIGCEFASLLSDLGAEVHVIEMMDQIVPGMCRSAARELQSRLSRRGVKFLLGASAGQPVRGPGSIEIPVGDRTVEADVILVAVGRRPNTENLGLEPIGIELDRGYVKVDPETMQTTVPGVFAVGDIVAGTPQLAHAGFAEALSAVRFIATGEGRPVKYATIPLVVYSRPEMAQVGLTEEAARQLGVEVTIHQRTYGGGGRALIKGEKRGLVRILVDDADRVVGSSVVGPEAGELIHEMMVTMSSGLSVDDAAGLIHAHPTLSETVGETLLTAAGIHLH
ncbi:MAG: dihydrolipoyl dehydrogenase [Acidimicrobiia bacterium]